MQFSVTYWNLLCFSLGLFAKTNGTYGEHYFNAGNNNEILNLSTFKWQEVDHMKCLHENKLMVKKFWFFKNNYCTLFILTGGTERQMLASLEDIVDKSLPLSKLQTHFQDPEAAKLCILNKMSFCEARQKLSFPFLPYFFFYKYPNNTCWRTVHLLLNYGLKR